MKYVWASWENKIEGQLRTAENINVRTRHIRGYGCAVTFSTAHIRWSTPAVTYVPEKKSFASSMDR